jgi:SAM-dependent methyltransferase
MHCRICSASAVQAVGSLMAYLDYRVDVFDCLRCGCRFTKRDDRVYECLHSNAHSTYGMHQRLADTVKRYFDAGDISKLEQILLAEVKNKHIIDIARTLPAGARVLEAGCSVGYLTSWFIANEFKVTATDVSKTAIDKAVSLFGPHFCLVNDARIKGNAPYDFIYHAGTIGCVDDPIGLTRYFVSLLKRGGRLVFNAPNKALADQLGRLWPYTTTPPDLVTLFPKSFWQVQFSDIAEVAVTPLCMSNRSALLFRMLPVFVMRAQPKLFKKSPVLRFALRVVSALARCTLLLTSGTTESTMPAEFGALVTMQKR